MITEHFGRGAPTEGFSGTTVESCGNSCEILGVMSAQVCAFGKVLTQQTVGVLIRPSLPRAMRIAEVDRQIGVDPELGVHYLPVRPYCVADTVNRLRYRRRMRLAIPGLLSLLLFECIPVQLSQGRSYLCDFPVVRCTSTRMLFFLGVSCTISHASHRPPFVNTA